VLNIWNNRNVCRTDIKCIECKDGLRNKIKSTLVDIYVMNNITLNKRLVFFFMT